MNWWTKGNGYFPGLKTDIAVQAQQLVDYLPIQGKQGQTRH